MRRRAVLAAASLLPSWGALAQSFPTRPIRLVVPFPPGGGTDTLARPFAERLRARLGQPVIPENRGGAASNIGMEQVARAPADGYTLVVNADNVALFPHLYQRLPYDLFRDFAPISYLAATPMVIAGHPAVPARTLAEMIALAQREPDRLNFASAGQGTPHHLAWELFQRVAGIRVTQIEYRGNGPAMTDVMAGHVSLGVFSLGAAQPHFAAGTLRPFAVLSPQRAPTAPAIPTTAEAGLPDARMALRFLLMAPAATPREIIALLNAATREVLSDSDLAASLTRSGFDVLVSTPEEAAEELRGEYTRWQPILRDLGIRLG